MEDGGTTQANQGTPHHSAQIEPLWHAWISYAVDTPPTLDPLAKTARSWAKPYHIPNYTATRGAYKPYNTYVHTRQDLTVYIPFVYESDKVFSSVKPKIDAWEPFAKQR